METFLEVVIELALELMEPIVTLIIKKRAKKKKSSEETVQ
jgi:hypothetical protein